MNSYGVEWIPTRVVPTAVRVDIVERADGLAAHAQQLIVARIPTQAPDSDPSTGARVDGAVPRSPRVPRVNLAPYYPYAPRCDSADGGAVLRSRPPPLTALRVNLPHSMRREDGVMEYAVIESSVLYAVIEGGSLVLYAVIARSVRS